MVYIVVFCSAVNEAWPACDKFGRMLMFQSWQAGEEYVKPLMPKMGYTTYRIYEWPWHPQGV